MIESINRTFVRTLRGPVPRAWGRFRKNTSSNDGRIIKGETWRITE